MNENKKQKTITIKLRTIIIAIVVLTSALLISNAYATTNGYDNIFFMIKEKVLGQPQETSGKEALLSDRDITISYTSIEVAEKIKIQIQRILLEKDNATLFVYVSADDENQLPLSYKIYNEANELVADYKGDINSKMDAIRTTKSIKETEIIKLEVFNKEGKLLSTILINLKDKELTVDGEKVEVAKISEAELKEYLSLFCLLKTNTGDIEGNQHGDDQGIYINIAFALNTNILKLKKVPGANMVNDIVDSFAGRELEKDENGMIKTEAYQYDAQKNEYLHKGINWGRGICLEIEDISYNNQNYTVDFVYCVDMSGPGDNVNIEELPKYKATINLSFNPDTQYSKYKINAFQVFGVVDGTTLNNEPENNSSNENTGNNTANEKDYAGIINEYRTVISDREYNNLSEDEKISKYPNINRGMMHYYGSENYGFELVYTFLDVNNDEGKDLVFLSRIYDTNNQPIYRIIDVFGYNQEVIKISDASYSSLGDRSKATIYNNNVLYVQGSISASEGTLTFYNLVSGEQIDRIYYDSSNGISFYNSSDKTHKLEYNTFEEVINLYVGESDEIDLNSLSMRSLAYMYEGVQEINGDDAIKALENATFCIEDIEENGEEYKITAFILEKDSRKLSDSEYESLKRGGEITFRNMKWKLDKNANGNYEQIVSGNSRLNITSSKTIDNIAGRKGELRDYSNKKVVFNVSKNILIGDYWTTFKFNDNGDVVPYSIQGNAPIDNFSSMSFERLLEISEESCGGSEECHAFINNNIIKALKIDNK